MNNVLLNLLKDLQIIEHGLFTTRGGKETKYYINVKKAYKDPAALDLISEEFSKRIPKSTTNIAVTGIGAYPIGGLISVKSGKPLTIVREIAKDHGTSKRIEAYIPKASDKTYIIDDVLTMGTSLGITVDALKDTGTEIIGACVLVKRGEANLGFPINHVFTTKDLM